jgi:hypothetical protein
VIGGSIPQSLLQELDMASESKQGPEIVFGLVGSVGTDLDFVSQCISSALNDLNYHSLSVRLSELMRDIELDDWKALKQSPAYDRYAEHMTAGNQVRAFMNRGDALAMLAVGAIREARAEKTGNPNIPLGRHAFILKSLKHPYEVQTLRTIYGP